MKKEIFIVLSLEFCGEKFCFQAPNFHAIRNFTTCNRKFLQKY
jgi:hypothetical protein